MTDEQVLIPLGYPILKSWWLTPPIQKKKTFKKTLGIACHVEGHLGPIGF